MPSLIPESDSKSPRELAWRRFRRHRLAWVSLCVFFTFCILVTVIPFIMDIFFGINYRTVSLEHRFSEPSLLHFLGRDELGRDVFVRLFYGGRISLAVALLSAVASLVIGTTIGAMAGYYGGMLDAILMRFTDAMLALPSLPLMILLAAIDFQKIFPESFAFLTQGNWASMLKLVIVIVFFGWMTVARLVRAEFLSLREREFVLASRALGAHHQKIIWIHILPNCVAPIIVAITLSIGGIILYEAILSFIGLGIQPPIPSWGNMLHHALEYIRTAPWLAVLPGLFILLTVVCLNFLGDGLRDALDPRFTIEKA